MRLEIFTAIPQILAVDLYVPEQSLIGRCSCVHVLWSQTLSTNKIRCMLSAQLSRKSNGSLLGAHND